MMQDSMLQGEFYIDEWLVQPLANRVSRQGSAKKLEPKVMHVLVCLAEHQGEVVTREWLLAHVWPDTIVGEEALNNAVSKLRRVFGETARSPRYIETISKSGYRLLVPIQMKGSAGSIEAQSSMEQSTKTVVPTSSSSARWLILIPALAAVFLGLRWWQSEQVPSVRSEMTSSMPGTLIPRILTSYDGYEAAPSLSPDGTRVAFVWNGAEEQNWDLYIKQPDKEIPLRLTNDEHLDLHPAWSPDGMSIAFQRLDGEERGIYVIPSIGGAPRRVETEIKSVYPDVTWSADGMFLLFNGRIDEKEPYALMEIPSSGGQHRRLTNPPATYWGDHDPAFSRDGNYVAFVRSVSEGNQDVWLLDRKAETVRRLTSDSRNIQGITWGEDGEHVVFSSNRGGVYALWTVSKSAGEIRPLPVAAWYIANPHLSVQGKLVFQQMQPKVNLYKGSLNKQEILTGEVAHIGSTRWDLHPSISPDGSRVAFTSNRSGFFEIWMCAADGANPVRLTSFNGPFTGTANWSPDGKALIFDSRPDGYADIFTIQIAGGQPERLTRDHGDNLGASWSADGRSVYYASARSGAWRLWRQALHGKETAMVLDEDAFMGRESPDGRYLYFTRYQSAGLWRREIDNGSIEKFLDAPALDDWGSWSVTTEGVFVLVGPFNNRHVLFRDHDANPERNVGSVPGAVPNRDAAFAMAPDGSWFLFGRAEAVQSDLFIAEWP